MPDRDRSTHAAPGPASAFPAKAAPSRSIPARVSDQAYSPRRSRPTMRQQPRAAPRVPPASLPGIPKHAFTSRHPHKTFLCTKSVPPIIKGLPDGSASSSQEGPVPYFQRYSSGPEASERGKETEKFRPSSLSSLPPPSSPAVWHVPFQTAASQRRGPAARPEESFFGDGESTSPGSFYKKRPFPSRHPSAPRPFPNKKSGAVACTRFHRKNKGTRIGYFLSPLCLRL